MQTFKATRVEREDAPPTPHRGQWRVHGRRTPGRVVMVILEGSCWVRRDDGSWEDPTAKSVVIWEPGEWVEYGGASTRSQAVAQARELGLLDG